MAARSAQRDGRELFTAHEQVNQRRYEALRSFFVEGLTHAEAGQRFGYTRWAMVNLTTDPTKPQIDLYAQLDLPLPKKIIEITPASH